MSIRKQVKGKVGERKLTPHREGKRKIAVSALPGKVVVEITSGLPLGDAPSQAVEMTAAEARKLAVLLIKTSRKAESRLESLVKTIKKHRRQRKVRRGSEHN